jgi:hypothetical protein
LVVAAALLVIGSVVTLGVLSWGLSTFRVVTDGRGLPAGMRALAIDTGDVPLAVRITADRGATEPRANLRLVNSTRAADNPLSVTNDATGTHISISGEASSFLEWARGGELTVTVPPELGRRLSVTTQQRTGVLMVQADLDQLVARTGDGPILLGGSARNIKAHTESGEVKTRDPISVRESFQADTGDGDIVVDFREGPPRTVEAISRHGDVAVALPGDGPFLVRAQSGGSTTVRVPETSTAADAVTAVTTRSDDGNVTVEGTR